MSDSWTQGICSFYLLGILCHWTSWYETMNEQVCFSRKTVKTPMALFDVFAPLWWPVNTLKLSILSHRIFMQYVFLNCSVFINTSWFKWFSFNKAKKSKDILLLWNNSAILIVWPKAINNVRFVETTTLKYSDDNLK